MQTGIDRGEEVIRRGRKFYYVCKCGNPKKLTNSYCTECNRKWGKDIRRKQKEIKLRRQELITFVEKINSRGGYASTEEIFVEMISFWNDYCPIRQKDIHSFNVKYQLESIWTYLDSLVYFWSIGSKKTPELYLNVNGEMLTLKDIIKLCSKDRQMKKKYLWLAPADPRCLKGCNQF